MSKLSATRNHRLLTPVNITMIGVMTALATVIYYFLPEIPIIPGVEYMKIDFSDIPAILLGITVNPVAGFLVEVFKNAVHLLKTTTMGVGELLNIGVGAVIVFVMHGALAGFSKLLHRDRLHPLPYFCAAGVTVAATVAAGWLLNWALTPLYFSAMGWPLSGEVLLAGVFGSTALNAVKAALNLLPFYPLVRGVDRALQKMH